MRVIPLTSLLSHKGRGSPNRDDTLSLEIKELFKHTLRIYLKTTHVIPKEPPGSAQDELRD